MEEGARSPVELVPSSTPPRESAVSVSTNGAEGFCRVPGCPPKSMENASNYCLRHHICKEHFRAVIVMVDGKENRFCQKCSRLHELHMFEASQRSCRESLELRKKRHRQQTEKRNKLKLLEQQEAEAKRLKTRAAAATSSWHLQAPTLAEHSALQEQAQQLKGWPHNAQQGGLPDYLMTLQNSSPASAMQVLAAALQQQPTAPAAPANSSTSMTPQLAHLLSNSGAGLLPQPQQGPPDMSSLLTAMFATLRPQTLPTQAEQASLPMLTGLSAPMMPTWPAALQPKTSQAPSLSALAELASRKGVKQEHPVPSTSQTDASVTDLANLLALYQQPTAVQSVPQPQQDDGGLRKLLELISSTASTQTGPGAAPTAWAPAPVPDVPFQSTTTPGDLGRLASALPHLNGDQRNSVNVAPNKQPLYYSSPAEAAWLSMHTSAACLSRENLEHQHGKQYLS